MSPFALVGYSAVAVVVVGWLIISFSAPSPRRVVIEWLAASALYVALCALFASLCNRAWQGDNTFALIAFGFLLVVFIGGGLVSLSNALLALRSSGSQQQSATN